MHIVYPSYNLLSPTLPRLAHVATQLDGMNPFLKEKNQHAPLDLRLTLIDQSNHSL